VLIKFLTYYLSLSSAIPSALDKYKSATPINRLADPEEIAGPVVFLLTPASSYVTGVCINVDGGASVMMFDGPTVGRKRGSGLM